MVNKISTSVFLNPHINKEGKSKLYIQVLIDRKTKRYPLEIFIYPKDFCRKTKKVKGADKDRINRIILREINRINDIYLELRELGEPINFETFENKYFDKAQVSLSEIIKLHCEKLPYSRFLRYSTLENKLKALFGDDITINEISLTKIQEFDRSLKGLANNTIWDNHKDLKALINTAIRLGLYKHENPYKNFKTKYVQTMRTFLTADELALIEEKVDTFPDVVKKIANVFLFQCYTGLRYSDVAALKWENIRNNFIIIQTEKTNEIVNIPIVNKAQTILDKQKNSNDKIFSIPSNQKYNHYLKLVALYAGVDKNLTSHVARHTFATISIELGIPIEIISKLLGHKDLSTTKIYAKILNPVLSEYMKKWDK
ncbi:MAG: tyrosine-type recombinase/integrase [Bacteroidales bacterium]|jgi:integrase|nr:site-specific integrase [Bacteroidales bacterium]MCK9500177.1 site-specific integrase [Bacteroidales bacterium]MDY0314428.1 tyrosine-type recombinase/integrase [Bacteroidales bacterium]NLB85721.1 tyrosine-type recombinase/integrase [Bacteroidales bacterium]